MTQEDAQLARTLLTRHGWEAYHYRASKYGRVYAVTASWPPMQRTAHEMGAPEAAWYSIRSLRDVVRAVCLYSAIKREGSEAA